MEWRAEKAADVHLILEDRWGEGHADIESMDDETELYWLAGLLEGEGSFLAGPPSSPNCPRIQLAMTDRDVVAHAGRLFDRPVWRSDRGREIGYKPAFLTAIKGAPAASLMTALRPVIGLRRQAQIDRALARPHCRVIRWRGDRSCTVPSCTRRMRTKGLCKVHYDSWWKAKKRGRASRYTPVGPPLPASLDHVGPLAPSSPGTVAALAWLAGLLEGEGTFEAHRQGAFTYPRISISMCDEDVVRRASELLSSRSVWREDPREEGWSPTFGTAITGARAAVIMSDLLPYMGERRSSEIRIALDRYRPIRVGWRERSCVVPGCGRDHDSRGLCHRHHMQWWRDVRQGRTPRVIPLR